MKRKLFVVLIILFANHVLQAQALLPDIDNWFPFVQKNNVENGVVGMSDWLDAPADKHGFIQNKGNKLVFEEGKTIKLLGINICSNHFCKKQQKVCGRSS